MQKEHFPPSKSIDPWAVFLSRTSQVTKTANHFFTIVRQYRLCSVVCFSLSYRLDDVGGNFVVVVEMSCCGSWEPICGRSGFLYYKRKMSIVQKNYTYVSWSLEHCNGIFKRLLSVAREKAGECHCFRNNSLLPVARVERIR